MLLNAVISGLMSLLIQCAHRAFVLLFLISVGTLVGCAQDTPQSMDPPLVSYPVVHGEDTLIHLVAPGEYPSAGKRAAAMAKALDRLLLSSAVDFDSFDTFRDGELVKVTYEDAAIFSIYPSDTTGTSLQQQQLAELLVERLEDHAVNRLGFGGMVSTVKRIALLVGLILSFFLLIRLLNKGISRFNKFIYKKVQNRISGYTNPKNRFFTMNRVADLIGLFLKLVKFLLILVIVYALLPVGFSIFPSTEDIALKLIGYVMDPVRSFGRAFIDYIPQMIAVIVIVLIARGLIRVLRYVSNEIRYERLQIEGFYPEWAHPTFNLLKVFILTFAFVAIFPLIPGSGSDVFKGVSVFFGLLISLGSSSAIGSIIAGLVITYMRPFQIGDRVRIGDATGDVVEKTLLVTRLRTIKNEDVTIPNSSILLGSTINFSANAKEYGLILNASVTIGYDVPWRDVHAMLIEAAGRTGELLNDPKPFVLQTSLDDFYVNYQINCYTDKAAISASIYSELYGHIQDVFAENNIEILSPHYRAERMGSTSTVPPRARGGDEPSERN
jgi:small-conductance mechanosensitive channel